MDVLGAGKVSPKLNLRKEEAFLEQRPLRRWQLCILEVLCFREPAANKWFLMATESHESEV